MNWEFIIPATLAIVGAALIAGGFVAFRGTRTAGVRAFAASAVAGGVVMWAVVVLTTPLSVTTSGPQEPTVVGMEAGSGPA